MGLKLFWPGMVGLALVAGCGGAASAPAQTPANTARAQARAAIQLSVTAWNVVAGACITVSQSGENVNVAASCYDALAPAQEILMAAAEAVDTNWSPSSACALSQGMGLVAKAMPGLPFDTTDTALIEDAAALVKGVLGSTACAADAGAE